MAETGLEIESLDAKVASCMPLPEGQFLLVVLFPAEYALLAKHLDNKKIVEVVRSWDQQDNCSEVNLRLIRLDLIESSSAM